MKTRFGGNAMPHKTPSSRRSTEKNKQTGRRCAPTSDADAAQRDSGLPRGGAGRRDVVEPIPGGIRVDPYITEGNPGYEESGGSETRPIERRASGGAKAMPQGKSRKS
jgi:hypothetical protein